MNLKFNYGTEAKKNKLITETEFDYRFLGKYESLFTQGNGYLGVRHALEEAYTGETRNMFVAGTFNKAGKNEVSELPNLPDITNISISVNGYPLTLQMGKVEGYYRTLDLETGEVIRSFIWILPNEKKVRFRFSRFVSLDNKHIIASKLEIIPLTEKIQIQIKSGINGSVTNSGAQHLTDISVRLYTDGIMEYLAHTSESNIPIVIYSAISSKTSASTKPIIKRREIYQDSTYTIEKGDCFVYEKISSVHTGRDLRYKNIAPMVSMEELQSHGKKNVLNAIKQGYDRLYESSNKEWEKFWKTSDVIIEGDDFAQIALRFSLYHLNIMTNKKDSRVGVGAKGLSGEGYKGHSFWDTEIFILPFFQYTHPEVARTLLEYRFNSLEGAERKARENGYSGAMYPWESGWFEDGEVAPRFHGTDIITGKPLEVFTGLIEQHITADIAYAVWQYYESTKDVEFMEKCGYEIILKTGLFWATRLDYNEKLKIYEILDVIGPDEYKEHVNNNAYTNYMAKYNMDLALKVINILETKKELWGKLNDKCDIRQIHQMITLRRDQLYLPVPNEDGIIPQTDDYLELPFIDIGQYIKSDKVLTILDNYNLKQLSQYAVSKQADLVMLFYLFKDFYNTEIRKKNFIYYEKRTLHDSSLSKSVHSIVANKLNMEEMAYELFMGALKVDLGPDMYSSDEGIHAAACGGIWNCVVLGFGGLNTYNGEITINPKIPKSWESLTYQVVVKGVILLVEINKQKLIITNKGDTSIELNVYQKAVFLKDKERFIYYYEI